MLSAALLGLLIANIPTLRHIADLKLLSLPITALHMNLSLDEWISDLLLAVFFFIVAVELKTELLDGELNSLRKALVPIISAIGGVLVPALIFLAIAGSTDPRGWPVPTATDIAFAVGVLAIFGPSVPNRMRVFLLALAVIDDLFGILFIAVFFTRGLDLIALAAAVLTVVAFSLVSRISKLNGPMAVGLLVILAITAWILVQRAGIHPTIAAVALGLTIATDRGKIVAYHLQPWSNGIVLPLFAFTAALVVIPPAGDLGPIFYGLAGALPFGKAVGIALGGLAGARLARRDLRDPILGWDLLALAVTGGIGFTVALLMGQLAFGQRSPYLDESVLGILAGSGIALVLGSSLVAWRSRIYSRRAVPVHADVGEAMC